MTLNNNKTLPDIIQELIVLTNNINERVHMIEQKLGIKASIEAFKCEGCGNHYGTAIDVDTYACIKCGGRLFSPVTKYESS